MRAEIGQTPPHYARKQVRSPGLFVASMLGEWPKELVVRGRRLIGVYFHRRDVSDR
jgi:hypothetical protein